MIFPTLLRKTPSAQRTVIVELSRFDCYSGMPIFRTSNGKENCFEKIGLFEKSREKLQCSTEAGGGVGNEFWVELTGGSKNRGFEKSGFHRS